MEIENDEEQQQQQQPAKDTVEKEEILSSDLTAAMSGELDHSKDSNHSTEPSTDGLTTSTGISDESSEDDGDSSKWAKYTRLAVFSVAFIGGLVLCCTDKVGDQNISQTFGIAIWISALWLTELVPLVVTALMPLFLFPMFGILSSGQVASAYVNDTIFLFISGMW